MTIIIPTNSSVSLLRGAIKSISNCVLPNIYDELVVIENGCRSGVQPVVDSVPPRLNARYMYRDRANKSYALNEALETVQNQLVVFFDDDVYVHEDTLVAYAEVSGDYDNRCTFFGGPVGVIREIDPPESFLSFFPHSVRGYDLDTSRMGDYYIGFNWAAFSSDIKRLGGFDPRFGPGSRLGATGQETNMQRRLLEDGCRGTDVPKALVYHRPPSKHSRVSWLLKRKFKNGVSVGLEDGQPVRDFCVLYTYRCVVNLVVLFYGLLSLDKERSLFSILRFFKIAGIVRGYFG